MSDPEKQERTRSQSEITEEDNLQAALLLREEARALFERENYSIALQRYEDALIDLEKGFFRPTPSSAWREAQMTLTYGMVQCLAALKQHIRAVLLCRSYLESNPTSLPVRIALASVLSDMGKYDDALAELRRVSAISPGNEGVQGRIETLSRLKMQQLREKKSWYRRGEVWWVLLVLAGLWLLFRRRRIKF